MVGNSILPGETAGVPDKGPGSGLSMVGDFVGKLLGIPGEVLGGAGKAFADSVRPDGKISLIRLMDIGGVRTAENKAKDLADRAKEAQVKALEIANQYEPQRQQLAMAQGIGKIQALAPDTQQAIANMLAENTVSQVPYDPNTPTTEGTQAAVAAAQADLGVAPDQIAAARARSQAGLTGLSSITGLPESGLSAFEGASAQDIAKTALRVTQGHALESQRTHNRRDEIVLRGVQQRLTNQEKRLGEDYSKNYFSILRQLIAKTPTTIHETTEKPVYPGHPEYGTETKNITRTRPLQKEDVQAAAEQAKKLVQDAIMEFNTVGGKAPKSASYAGFAAMNKAKQAAGGYASKGLPPADAAAGAIADMAGPEVAFQMPPRTGQDGRRFDDSFMVSQAADRAQQFDRLRKAGVASVSGLNLNQLVDQMFLTAGYDDADLPALRQAFVAEIRRREGK